MLKLYKIHHTSEEYDVYKSEERNHSIKKLISNNILKKLNIVRKDSVLGKSPIKVGAESFTGTKVWVEKQHNIERRANLTTAMGD
eukprot:CAMPEP_0116898682 /NCGR_PEP_ID=MMETSP0467-20121206/7370_1 /TAXON_ID=283647 /ORGANISM="Mesodinium pulex, Strain SPMC105" /LENGTH=84 /DNA_ID=CAMNT_0004570985 /DNA_START=492 /DNA_END=746 /DNA_ORIENTATION=-